MAEKRVPRSPGSSSSSADAFRKDDSFDESRSLDTSMWSEIAMMYRTDRGIGGDFSAQSKPRATWIGGRLSSLRAIRLATVTFMTVIVILVMSVYHEDLRSRAGLSHRTAKKPADVKIIGLVFYGRPNVVEILDCYLQRNLAANGGYLDEVHFVVNTDHLEDVKWLDEVVIPSHKDYIKVVPPKEGDGKDTFANIWATVESGNLYVKIDDDVVYIHDDAIAELVHARLDHPDAFVITANTINSPLMSWVHYRQGATHPYMPELKPPPGFIAPDHEGAIIPDWRPSLLPTWSGPSDYRLDQKAPAPFNGHRWLPLAHDPNHNMFRQTPVFDIEYHPFGSAWKHWGIAAQAHASFFENLEKNQLDLYKTRNKVWDHTGSRISINMIAIWGQDIVNNGPITDDENTITWKLPKKLNKSTYVATHSIVSHLTFGTQRPMLETDMLQRYRSYALEKICKN